MTQNIGPAGAAAMLTWNSDDCPACGCNIGTVGIQNVRVTSAVPEVISYPLCADCLVLIDKGDDAAFGRIVRAAERRVESAVLTAELKAVQEARSDDLPKLQVH